MASGFCVRELLFSLLAFGLHANALSYRSGGSSGIKPYFKPVEDFSRSYKPAFTSSGYEGSAPSGGSVNSYGPSYTESASSQNMKPAAAPSAGGYSGFYGRQVGRYSPEGSVPSSKPGPLTHQNPQQPHYQSNPGANGVRQTKADMWNFAQPIYPGKPQPPSYLVSQSKAGTWNLALPNSPLQACSQDDRKRDFEKIFAHYDVSKTGALEGPEVDGFVKDMMELEKPSISSTDLDKFRKALMGRCDFNRDGKIQKNELALCLGLNFV